MDKSNLLSSSPVRYFDSTKATLNPGEIGLITAKKGLGKTSVLVQFGLDELLKDKALVHVSFDQKSSNVISWYSSVLAEIAKKKNIGNLSELEDDIVKNRTILNFNQETFTLPKVVNTIKALKDGGIKIEAIVVDGLDLAKTEKADLDCIAKFVKDEKLVGYFSYTSEAETLKETLPAEKTDIFASVAHIAAFGKDVCLTILKGGDGKVTLDAKTLLMSK